VFKKGNEFPYKAMNYHKRKAYDDWPRRSSGGGEQNWHKWNSKGNEVKNLRREVHSIGSSRRENGIEGFRLIPIT